uniref:14 kDa zinc-binding protein (Trinotate prediction) n=1 Tax=Myxobolus squamalis TaxID=59785 RepID=A0A6B2G315_MYXSQ
MSHFRLQHNYERTSEESIFTKIIKRELPATIIYEDDKALVIKDLYPQAPVHLLAIPKKQIGSISEMSDEDIELMGYMMKVIRDVAKQENLEMGYRVVSNNGIHACQAVYHVHFHILAGKQLSGQVN